VLGVIVVINRVDEVPFTETDKNLLESLADQASVAVHYLRQSAALDEKRQIDRDLSLAREIQTALLPKQIPEINGVNIAAFSKAAQRIGGDYYDFMKIDDEHVGIITADVSGKGISGAIVMSICRSIIRALAPGNLSPAAVLKAANAALTRDLAEDLFITVLYMVLNTRTLELKIARAGHLAPLVFRGKMKELVPMDSDGIAIGISDAAAFDAVLQERSMMLHGGDMVLAYTDGITEAMDQNGNEWAEDNLADTVQETLRGGGKAADVARDVRRVLVDFVGSTAQQDDMTMVALQVD
jgi:phosphoserine phosphatase RsbU/P